MSKWKTNLKKVLASASLLLLPFSTVSAYDGYSSYCDPCCGPSYNCCDCGGFKIGADFLYWKPCVDDLTYAGVICAPDFFISNGASAQNHITTALSAKYKDICTKWEPGVRVMASLPNAVCCWDAMASFTYIQSCDNACCSVAPFENLIEPPECFIVSPLVHPVFGPAFFGGEGVFDCVKGKWKADYYNADLLLGYNICLNPCLNIKPYFGVAGIYLEQDMKFCGFNKLFNDEFETDCFLLRTNWCSHYWGVGLKMGSYFEQTLCNCFSFFANGSASLLAGHTDKHTNRQCVPDFDTGTVTPIASSWSSRARQACDSNGCDSCNGNGSCGSSCSHCDEDLICFCFKNDDCCLFVPGYHIQAGFKYASNMCGCNYGLRIGYEFLYWHNVPNPRIFSETGFISPVSILNSQSPNTRTFGFHGLFAGLEFGF